MKKIFGMIIAVVMILMTCCTACFADEVPQPDGGKKFESKWAFVGGTADIYYELEGYKVLVQVYDEEQMKGTNWEYSCYYDEASDSLQSFSSLKTSFTRDPETLEEKFGDPEYEGIDEAENVTVFSLKDSGRILTWTDGHNPDTSEIEFNKVGTFQGMWRNDEEDVWVKMTWNGKDHDSFCYDVLLHRGGDEKTYTEFQMKGIYNRETEKLECKGNATVWTENTPGSYDPVADDNEYEAVFSRGENGKLLYEAANGIELEYDFLDATDTNG